MRVLLLLLVRQSLIVLGLLVVGVLQETLVGLALQGHLGRVGVLFPEPRQNIRDASRDAHSKAAGPATSAATVSALLNAVDAANAGFGARLLARRRAGALDSAVDKDESIFALQASARWDYNGGSTVGWFAN